MGSFAEEAEQQSYSIKVSFFYKPLTLNDFWLKLRGIDSVNNQLRFRIRNVSFSADGISICSRTMKVHQLFALLAIMLLGANTSLFGAEEKSGTTTFVANFTGIT